MVNGALYHCKVSASRGEWGLQFGLQAGCCRCWRKASSRSWPRVARLQIHHCDPLCFALSHFGPPEGGSCCKLWVRILGIILGFRRAVKAPAINFFCSSRSQGFSTLFISLGKSYWWRLSDFLTRCMMGITWLWMACTCSSFCRWILPRYDLSRSLICLQIPRHRVQCGVSIRHEGTGLALSNPEAPLANAFTSRGGWFPCVHVTGPK